MTDNELIKAVKLRYSQAAHSWRINGKQKSDMDRLRFWLDAALTLDPEMSIGEIDSLDFLYKKKLPSDLGIENYAKLYVHYWDGSSEKGYYNLTECGHLPVQLFVSHEAAFHYVKRHSTEICPTCKKEIHAKFDWVAID